MIDSIVTFQPKIKLIDKLSCIHHKKRIPTGSKQKQPKNSIDMLIWTTFQIKTILISVKLDQNKPNLTVLLSATFYFFNSDYLRVYLFQHRLGLWVNHHHMSKP